MIYIAPTVLFAPQYCSHFIDAHPSTCAPVLFASQYCSRAPVLPALQCCSHPSTQQCCSHTTVLPSHNSAALTLPSAVRTPALLTCAPVLPALQCCSHPMKMLYENFCPTKLRGESMEAELYLEREGGPVRTAMPLPPPGQPVSSYSSGSMGWSDDFHHENLACILCVTWLLVNSKV